MSSALALVGDIRASARRVREINLPGEPPERRENAAASTAHQSAAQQPAQIAELGRLVTAYHHASEQLRVSHEVLLQQVGQLQDQLASTDAQLQRSQRLAALGEMAAGIAHEVRNPLAAIQLYTNDLLAILNSIGEGGCPETTDAIEVTHHIDAAVRGLDRLVGDVLSFARELRPMIRPCNARDVIRQALNLAHPGFDERQVRIVCEGDLDREISADFDLLQQALLNLFRNAAEALADTPDERVVRIGVAGDDNWATIAVSDTGPGIASSVIERIFNPFVSTRDAGTGLGLAIVHRIADAHGGTIAAENPPEGGARFTLYLPDRASAPGAGD